MVSSLLSHLPASKCAKYGMKAYKLWEASGYTFRFKLYTGQSWVSTDSQELGTLDSLVMDLMTGLPNQGQVLYMDNCGVARMLYQQQMHVVRTLWINRKDVPKDLAKLELQPGDVKSSTLVTQLLFWCHMTSVTSTWSQHYMTLQCKWSQKEKPTVRLGNQ